MDYKTQIEKYKENIKKINDFLKNNEKKVSKRGRESKSNITDNESAKMISPHGMIQGYNGVALVDSKCQIIVHSIDGYIPDTYYRQRDPRFPEKNLYRKNKQVFA